MVKQMQEQSIYTNYFKRRNIDYRQHVQLIAHPSPEPRIERVRMRMIGWEKSLITALELGHHFVKFSFSAIDLHTNYLRLMSQIQIACFNSDTSAHRDNLILFRYI